MFANIMETLGILLTLWASSWAGYRIFNLAKSKASDMPLGKVKPLDFIVAVTFAVGVYLHHYSTVDRMLISLGTYLVWVVAMSAGAIFVLAIGAYFSSPSTVIKLEIFEMMVIWALFPAAPALKTLTIAVVGIALLGICLGYYVYVTWAKSRGLLNEKQPELEV